MTLREDRDQLAREKLDLEDKLNDVMAGFRLWKRFKTQGMELTEEDEMFIRWVEYER